MDERRAWMVGRVRLGWAMVGLGVGLFALNVVLGAMNPGRGISQNILGGLGILALGMGIGWVVRYRSALHDEAAARRIAVEERDERSVQIRTRAGNRAWIVSAIFVVTALMWSSMAGFADLPALSGDVLWWYLAVALGVPFLVYAGSITLDERRF